MIMINYYSKTYEFQYAMYWHILSLIRFCKGSRENELKNNLLNAQLTQTFNNYCWIPVLHSLTLIYTWYVFTIWSNAADRKKVHVSAVCRFTLMIRSINHSALSFIANNLPEHRIHLHVSKPTYQFKRLNNIFITCCIRSWLIITQKYLNNRLILLSMRRGEKWTFVSGVVVKCTANFLKNFNCSSLFRKIPLHWQNYVHTWCDFLYLLNLLLHHLGLTSK